MSTDRIICAFCNHEMTDDEMLSSGHDLFALAPKEELIDDLECPKCKKKFIVQGEYIPVYRTYKSEDEIF